MKPVGHRLFILALVALMVVVSGNLYAGRGDKAGTSAASELLIPVGGRGIALGGSSLATATGVDAIFWNPAGLARTKYATEAAFSHTNYIADIGVEYLAVGSTFEGFGTLGLSLKTLSFGDFEVTTEDNPDGNGQTFSPTYVTIGMTYSRMLADRVSIGFTTNLISERIDRVSATGVAFSFGVQYSGFVGVGGLNVGVAVKNIGPPMKFDGPGLLREASATDVSRPASFYKIEAASDELPSIIEIGIGYSYQLESQSVLALSTLFQNNNLSDDEYKLGLEYGYDNMFFVRGGYSLAQETISDSYIYGATLGAGVHYGFSGLDFSFDYAYRAAKFFGGTHAFALTLGF